MHWQYIKSGMGRAATPHEACQAKPCNLLWPSLKYYTYDFGLELDSSINHDKLPKLVQYPFPSEYGIMPVEIEVCQGPNRKD